MKVSGLNIDLKNDDDQLILIEQHKKFLAHWIFLCSF